MSATFSIWKRFRRTPYQSIASVFMMFITLFVLGLFLLMVASSSALLSYFESKPQLTVFFKNEKDKASIDQLVVKLNATEKLSSYKYVSKDEALVIYREQNKNDPLLLEMVTADILPSSLDISAVSPKYLNELYEIVKNEPGVDDIVFQKEVVDTLISWSTTIRRVGVIFILLLIFATFLILLTSVGMKIALKKEEIEILKLVGATNWYIKRPFVWEGITIGILGATMSSALTVLLIFYLKPYVSGFLKGIEPLRLISTEGFNIYIWPPNIIFLTAIIFILFTTGIFIGFIGSLFATSRYMRE